MNWKRGLAKTGGPLFHLAHGLRDRVRCLRAGAPMVPYGTDGVGYETFIAFIKRRKILERPGDLLEIGTRFGGGALKLSLWLERNLSAKTLHVVDCFGLIWESPANAADDLYLPELMRVRGGRTQREIYDELCAGRPNIKLWPVDSAKLDAPGLLCFGFLDGNHEPAYVENDFALIWDALTPGGALAAHDYRSNLPAVTKTLDKLLSAKQPQIADVEVDEKKHLLFVVKR